MLGPKPINARKIWRAALDVLRVLPREPQINKAVSMRSESADSGGRWASRLPTRWEFAQPRRDHMPLSSRRVMRTAAAVTILVGLGTGLASAVEVIERVMPAPRVEVIPAPPGAGYNWVPGHWAWRGAAWVWIPGHHVRGVVPA